MEKLSKNKLRKQKRYGDNKKPKSIKSNRTMNAQCNGRMKRKGIGIIITSLMESGTTEVHKAVLVKKKAKIKQKVAVPKKRARIKK